MGKNRTVLHGRLCRCTFGSCPAPLHVSPRKIPQDIPLACVADHHPMVNIKPFGLCSCPHNPQVRAASDPPGAQRPIPCIPAPADAWTDGDASLLLDGYPSLTENSTLRCAYGGVISLCD